MGIAIGIIVVLLVALVIVFNGLVLKRNRCENSFSTIDVMLKKRYDLIPNLVETVKGYAKHENATFTRIAELRSQAQAGGMTSEQTVAVNNEITGLLRRILAVVEAYPELKASDNFMHLQRALTELEEQISAARRAYNAAVLELNNSVQMFPSNLIAGAFGFKQRSFLEATKEERTTPNVGEKLQAH